MRSTLVSTRYLSINTGQCVTMLNHLTTTTTTSKLPLLPHHPAVNKCNNNPTKKSYAHSDVEVRGEARHLQDVATNLALKPRRSLRIQWQRDYAQSIQQSGGPWYTLILYGEDEYWINGALPRRAITLPSIPPVSPRLPPVTPRTLQSNIYQQQQQQINFGNSQPKSSPARLDSKFSQVQETFNPRKIITIPLQLLRR